MAYSRLKNRKNMTKESFDRNHPVAVAIREIMPPERVMDPGARAGMMERLLEIQRSTGAERPTRTRTTGRLKRWSLALVPAGVAVVATILLLVFLLSGGEGPVPVKRYATLEVQIGQVDVFEPGGSWRLGSSGEKLDVGSRVRSEPGAFASVTFQDGSLMRLTDGSEALIRALGSKSVTIEHLKGGTYHRVRSGTSYLVKNRDVSLRALGTVFNVENKVPERLEVVTVESAVQVEIGDLEPIQVSEGEVMVVTLEGQKKADKQPVSRERLEEGGLYANAKQDALEGYSTGVYEQLDVPLEGGPLDDKQGPPVNLMEISLGGKASDRGVALEWSIVGEATYDSLVLLRSETSEPDLPGDRIAKYYETMLTTATDDTVERGKTYQYRLAAVSGYESVALSNTVVVKIPEPGARPDRASISLVATPLRGGVLLEWSVNGATMFDGFVVERTVLKAPVGSSTPEGGSSVERVETQDVLYSLLDGDVSVNHRYSYRIGLLVDGVVMAYSNSVTVDFQGGK